MTFLIYIIKTLLLSGFLFGYYWLFLRNRLFHGFNRFFLLAIPFLSFLLPALQVEMPALWTHPAAAAPIRLLVTQQGKWEEAVTVYGNRAGESLLSWQFLGILLVFTVSTLGLIRLSKSLLYLVKLRRANPFIRLPEARLYFVSEEGTPFSFFKSIFWGREMDLHDRSGKQILRHELFHVTNHHSVDMLFLEILSALVWFNPFLILIRRELRAIHEYAADQHAAATTDSYSYARLLLLHATGKATAFAHPFFKNQIKRRIMMMTRSPKSKKTWMGRLMILPLLTALIALFSFKISHPFQIKSGRTIRVVVDAGHGGSFEGASWNGWMEKNINLEIAKKIQALASQYNVSVMMTRESDITPGSNELRQSLEYIAAMPKNNQADLFVSIHANISDDKGKGSYQDSKRGFEIYIPRNSSEVYENSQKFGSVLTDVIKSDYPIESTLKQIPESGGNILILKKATVPAVLIECGYMDNQKDLSYLTDEKNQEKIARDILEGIRRYATQNIVFSKPAGDNTSFSTTGDTLSFAEMGKINPWEIASMSVSRKENLVTVTLKNGRKYFTQINEQYYKSLDSSRKVNDRLDALHRIGSSASDTIYKVVEVEASYPGGQKGWLEYLVKNLKYPEAAVSNEIQGQVIVEFVVKMDGSLSEIHALSGPQALKAESVRVIRESGIWVPAKNNGKQVDSYHKQPINYKLEPK
jgi:N-acetylmuramoyl-L-alanine amidase